MIFQKYPWFSIEGDLTRAPRHDPVDFDHQPFNFSDEPRSSMCTNLLSYPRLREFYEVVRRFRCISIADFSFRIMPKCFSIEQTLQLTQVNLPHMEKAFSVRQTLMQEWHPSLLRMLNQLDSVPAETLTLLHNPLSPELVSSLLNLQVLNLLPSEVATIVAGQQLNMYLSLMLL